MFFLLKKFISIFIKPMIFCSILMIIGLYYLFKKEPNVKKGRIFLATGIGLLWILSWNPVAHHLIGPLEEAYPAYLSKKEGDNFKYIHVLGSGHNDDDRLPRLTQLGPEGQDRVIEGVRLARMFPDAKIIFSGYGGIFGKEPFAIAASEAAQDLGIDQERIILIKAARDTIDEAKLSYEIIGNESMLLVTSARHMPRSMGIFKKRGLNPTAAPCSFANGKDWRFISLPNAGSLTKSAKAIYETVGIIWAWLTGRF